VASVGCTIVVNVPTKFGDASNTLRKYIEEMLASIVPRLLRAFAGVSTVCIFVGGVLADKYGGEYSLSHITSHTICELFSKFAR